MKRGPAQVGGRKRGGRDGAVANAALLCVCGCGDDVLTVWVYERRRRGRREGGEGALFGVLFGRNTAEVLRSTVPHAETTDEAKGANEGETLC